MKLLSFLVSVNKNIAHPYSLISWRSLASLWTWRSLKEIKKGIQCLKDQKFDANRTVGNENSDVSTGPRRWKLLLAGCLWKHIQCKKFIPLPFQVVTTTNSPQNNLVFILILPSKSHDNAIIKWAKTFVTLWQKLIEWLWLHGITLFTLYCVPERYRKLHIWSN